MKKYVAYNKGLPDIILLYRDGVGDGQIGYVKEWEVKQFVSVIQECMKDKQYVFLFNFVVFAVKSSSIYLNILYFLIKIELKQLSFISYL